MLGWFRKKSQTDVDAQIKEASKQCIEVFKRTWRETSSNKPISTTAEQLAYQIEEFSQSAFHFMFTKFPITKHAPPFALWMLIFTAVFEAETHPKDQVNKAIDLLRSKYAN